MEVVNWYYSPTIKYFHTAGMYKLTAEYNVQISTKAAIKAYRINMFFTFLHASGVNIAP